MKMPIERALRLVLAGPRPEEAAAGIGTSLPAVTGRKTVEVALYSAREVRISLPMPLGGLDGTALSQLICTTAYAMDSPETITVRMTGRDGRTNTGTCDVGAHNRTDVPQSGPSADWPSE
ncbi:hypothetical protein ACWGLF_39730 [Streptomyces puniciscabiei]